jgi:methylated-DNA-protein-cysteine methyltransferase-like protein
MGMTSAAERARARARRRGRKRGEAGGPSEFHRRVWRAVRRVPRGKVATYGQIAAVLGHPRAARAVGTALAKLREGDVDTVPWQRVLASSGRCSHRDGFWAGVQRDLLEREGVRFGPGDRVDFARSGWKPRR